VRRALASGRIHAAQGGGIDPAVADQQWADTTRIRIDGRTAAGKPVLAHPCFAASWDLNLLLVRIEKRVHAVLMETVKRAPDYPTTAWPRLDREWNKLPDALERLQIELKRAVPLRADGGDRADAQ
jgi:hypothetical protein